MIDDNLLFSCNETELLWMARRQELVSSVEVYRRICSSLL
jgi:hypothetical protein